jgi:ubiquinone/menaquinone biosynthesis C-methylase UbiE
MDYQDYQDGTSQQHFWFKAKNELINILLSKINFDSKKHILDIGAGTGDNLSTLNKFGLIHVIDINQEALDLIATTVFEKKCCDACNLSYEDNSFDTVVAFDVLEHVEDDQQAISEIFRVLKPGGFFIFTVPAYQRLFSTHDRSLHHVMRYNKKDIRLLLKNFNPMYLGSWVSIPFPCIAIFRLITKNRRYSNYEKHSYKIINFLLYTILKGETWLIKKGIQLPWGLTIYGIYQKPIS